MSYVNKHNVVSIKTHEFKRALSQLQPQIQKLAYRLYEQWADGNPIKYKSCEASSDIWLAELNPRNRMIFTKFSYEDAYKLGVISERVKNAIDKEIANNDLNKPQVWVWHWIGTHETYNRLCYSVKQSEVIRNAISTAEHINKKDASLKARM
ncbi:hypothetical protein ACK32R_04145 [Aeromonas dhakensis]|jgi:hypothetical protein|uniref:hypothetical protein n=1 Tax=Aeromonas dhakensis TaxID=196024 RepID=UPI003986CDF3